MSIINDLKKLDIYQFAKVTKTTFSTIDDKHPIALHNWLKIPKGTTIGLIDNINPNLIDYHYPIHDIRAYASHGNAYVMVTLPYERIKLIKGKKKKNPIERE